MNIKKIMAGIMATTVVGSCMATMSVGAEIQDSYTFSLMGTVGTSQFWDSDAPTVEVDGDGSYSLEFKFDEATESTDGSGAIILSTDINAFDFAEEGATIDKTEIAKKTGINIKIDSVEIDGQKVDYSGPSTGAYVFNDDGNTIRLNVYNVWGNDVKDIDFNFVVEQSIKVNFTVEGLSDAMGTTPDTTTSGQTIGDSDGGTTTTIENKVDYSVYNQIITNAGNIVSNKGYDQVYENLGYYLFDINNDGVKELIVADNFDSEKDTTNNVEYIWGYYDIYTIKDGKAVEINQYVEEFEDKLFQVADGTYLSLAVVDGKLAYVVPNPDNADEALSFVIEGYEELDDGTLSVVVSYAEGSLKDYSELDLYDYTDKSALNKLTGTTNNNTNNSTTTTVKKTDSPATSDSGIGAIATLVAVAGLSAFVLKKNK